MMMRTVILPLLMCLSSLNAVGQKIYNNGEQCSDDEERLLTDLRLSNTLMFEDFKRSINKDTADIYGKLNTLESKVWDRKWAYFQQSFYFLSLDRQTWTNAQQLCSQHGSTLVEIETENEHAFIVNNVYDPNSANGGFVWLGATYNATANIFVWNSTGLPLTFNNWRTGEPKEPEGKTHCAHVHTKEKGIWDTTPCSFAVSYVCELKIF